MASVAETITRRRLAPLWARAAGLGDYSWNYEPEPAYVWEGGSSLSLVHFANARDTVLGTVSGPAFLLACGPAGLASVDGGAAAAPVFLGSYAGYPAWEIGGWFLFHSGLRSAWILFDELREPAAWTEEDYDSEGELVRTARGDTWHEGAIPAAFRRAETFECCGRAALEHEYNGGASPADRTLSLEMDAWASAGALPAGAPFGEYARCAGCRGAATMRVGHWRWTAPGGGAWAMDPEDRETLVGPGGEAVECPDGKWEVRRDDSGAWVADLSGAAWGEDLHAAYSRDQGAAGGGEPRDPITLPWAGPGAAPAGEIWAYAAARWL